MMKKVFILFFTSILLVGTSFGSDRKKEADKPKNIILMIGDGIGFSQIQAGLTVNKGQLHMLTFPVTGLQKTSSADDYITDSPAGGTALSTGKKTKNKYIGVDSTQKHLKSILEIAEDHSLSTGLVSTSSITHATPASFVAHQPSRYLMENIAQDFVSSDIDVFIGGGIKYFNNREDGKDLTTNLKEKGYTVLTDMESIKEFKGNKLAGFTAEEHNPKVTEGRGEMLSAATQKAIEILSKNEKGFFLMVEGSQIDWGGHDNDSEYVVSELLDFDRAVGLAKEFAASNKETLVIVTSDHETGGMTVLDGDYESGELKTVFSTGGHTGTMVPVFAFGPGAEQFTGFYENTEIFNKMKFLFGF